VLRHRRRRPEPHKNAAHINGTAQKNLKRQGFA
jgi:hypothetical protein